MDMMIIEGNTSFVIESRNKLDGARWKPYAYHTGPFKLLLDIYADNEYVEYRIKNLSLEAKPSKRGE